MNQNGSNEVESYLNQVSEHLGNLPDKDEILRELRQHIFDMANELSLTNQLTVMQAFREAINRMEEPAKLASKFVSSDSSPDTESPRMSQNYVPERKITNEQFTIMGLIGLISVLIISPIISFQLTSGQFLPFFFAMSFIAGLFIIIFFLFFLYYQDEKTRQEQITELRKTFQKIQTQFQGTKKKYPASQWAKTWEHASGVFELALIMLASAFIVYLTFWLPVPNLFNDNWFYIGFTIVAISLVVEGSVDVFKIVLGRVRILRLMNGIRHFILAILILFLLIYYPFTLSDALIEILPSDLVNKALEILTNIDFYAKIVMGIIASVQIMAGLYDFFKFGFWKPSDRRSLLSE
ncbi:MAG: HAAS signaling domain-containing protein [Candidatus Hodarchaeales archaeon]